MYHQLLAEELWRQKLEKHGWRVITVPWPEPAAPPVIAAPKSKETS